MYLRNNIWIVYFINKIHFDAFYLNKIKMKQYHVDKIYANFFLLFNDLIYLLGN